jgi:hypothetical protein
LAYFSSDGLDSFPASRIEIDKIQRRDYIRFNYIQTGIAPLLWRHFVNAKPFLIFAILAVLFLGSSPLPAHHSTAEYDLDKTTSVVGTVTEYAWNNPHAYIYLEVKNDKGGTEKWAGELGTLGQLSRANWRRDTVKPGDQITMYGNPAKDGRFLMRLQKVLLPNGQELMAQHVQQ